MKDGGRGIVFARATIYQPFQGFPPSIVRWVCAGGVGGLLYLERDSSAAAAGNARLV